MPVRKFVTVNGKRVYDFEIETETTCDHCGQVITGEDICLLSVRISSMSLTTEMGMVKPLSVHANCIYECLRAHIMERARNRAGKWYVAQTENVPEPPAQIPDISSGGRIPRRTT
jgi:hypothetical protein